MIQLGLRVPGTRCGFQLEYVFSLVEKCTRWYREANLKLEGAYFPLSNGIPMDFQLEIGFQLESNRKLYLDWDSDWAENS